MRQLAKHRVANTERRNKLENFFTAQQEIHRALIDALKAKKDLMNAFILRTSALAVTFLTNSLARSLDEFSAHSVLNGGL